VIIALALVAALLLGVGLVLQQHAAEQVPAAYFLRLRLIRELLRKRRWLAGLAIYTAGQIASAWVFGHLDLSIAEPLLSTSLLWALLLAVPLAGQGLRKSEIIGAVLLAAGVAALSVSRSVTSGQAVRFGSAAYWPVSAVIGLIAIFLVQAGRRHQGPQRATLTGAAAGLIFGVSDALTRSTLQTVSSHGVAAVLTSYPAYGLAAASVLAVWLMESAFNAAPLHASLPAITAAEPAVGITLGVLIFGDVVRVSPGTLALQGAGIAALVTGVILVARAPVLSGLRVIRPPPGSPRPAPARERPAPAPPARERPAPAPPAPGPAAPPVPGRPDSPEPPDPAGLSAGGGMLGGEEAADDR
jgi:drug/metabolite transporter (DMT)-like permease